jgi:glycine/sarcosine/dimethylglycine N-methyltransferase
MRHVPDEVKEEPDMPDSYRESPNADLDLREQVYGADPLEDRDTGHYRKEYVMAFVDKWDELIDWRGRAESEGQFFIDILRARGKQSVLDVAAGTGFHSVRLTEAGFDVVTADGSAAMLAKAFANAQKRGLILKTVQADWRWLNRDINGKYDAIICLGNSFTHLYEESDRRRALAEFYAALKHDGILILDQRNYDAMLDRGFSSKHKYYYCGDQVSAEPEHIDEGLVRMKYSFPDGSDFTLNLCPIRRNYVRRLLSEAGFQRVRTYGDFQETYAEDEPDFFIHVAEKSALHLVRWGGALPDGQTDIREVTEDYYDSDDADTFYSTIWGGEDLHIGIYEGGRDIRAASDATVDRMASMLSGLGPDCRVLDLGSGYGGAMRRLVRAHGCKAVGLNISATQNDYNRKKIRAAGLGDRIEVLHGVFEDVPAEQESFDVVWSQDSFLHSDQRDKVVAEAWRVLRPGGQFIFTDPCQADDVPPGVLQPVYDRLQLNSLGSLRFYREAAEALGFRLVQQEDLTHELRTHYDRVREEMLANYDRLRENGVSAEYLDKMAVGLENWVKAADAGHLYWGILLFQKPAAAE